jgi:hypothetical protein
VPGPQAPAATAPPLPAKTVPHTDRPAKPPRLPGQERGRHGGKKRKKARRAPPVPVTPSLPPPPPPQPAPVARPVSLDVELVNPAAVVPPRGRLSRRDLLVFGLGVVAGAAATGVGCWLAFRRAREG